MQEYTAHTEEYENLTIKIIQDTEPQNPREWDNLGTMVCKHSRYNLGDVQMQQDTAEEYLNDEYNIVEQEDQWELPDKEKEKIHKWIDKNLIILPLYLYDHGGITMSTGSFSCQWDSGQVGFIYIDREKMKKEYSVKYLTKKFREKIAGYLKNEVKEYDQYITGDCYGYTIENEDEEDLDSCWGFFGLEYCTQEAQAAAKATYNHIIEEQKKEHEQTKRGHFEQVKTWIKNHVPLQYRTALSMESKLGRCRG